MQGQIATGKPWGISVIGENEVIETFFWGDSLDVPSLSGRVFKHGIADCYSLVRDWYRLLGITLPVNPRDRDWWDLGQNIVDEGFEEKGFYKLPSPSDLRIGDVFIGRIGAKVNNHCGVYVGNGCVLHHLPKRLSKAETAHRWVASKVVSYAVRFKGEDIQKKAGLIPNAKETLILR